MFVTACRNRARRLAGGGAPEVQTHARNSVPDGGPAGPLPGAGAGAEAEAAAGGRDLPVHRSEVSRRCFFFFTLFLSSSTLSL